MKLIAAFGYRIVKVDDLPDAACVVPTQGVVLVRSGLTAWEKHEAARLLIPMLAGAPADPPTRTAR